MFLADVDQVEQGKGLHPVSLLGWLAVRVTSEQYALQGTRFQNWGSEWRIAPRRL